MSRRLRTTALALLTLLAAAAPASAAPVRPDPARLGIHHVWLVMLENRDFADAYVHNPNPYLSRTLPARGQLLTQYYGTGHLSLDNYISLLSGQAPTVDTEADCQVYRDVAPGARGPMGQAIGQGCVYPAWVKTLPDQLDAEGLSWRGYMEDMGNDENREPDRCGSPSNPAGAGFRDGTQSATAKDQYAARHNPFVYFHSILDSGRCETHVVPLPQLVTDLRSARTTPAFSFVTPNLCNDGHDDPCTGTNVRGTHAGGLKAVDYWLAKYVPLILHSPAFRDGGLLVISSDEAETDSSACCNEQPGYNVPLAGGGGISSGNPGPGGGRIGTVVLGRCVVPGSRNATPYNHYALLRSLEDVFGVRTGGSDGKGHLGYAGQSGLRPFGADVFGGCAGRAAPTRTATHRGAAAASAGGGVLAATGGLPGAGSGLGLVLLATAAQRLRRRAVR